MKDLGRDLVKSRIGRNVSVEKWRIAVSGRQMDSVRKEISVVFTTRPILVKEHNHPLLQ